MVFVSFPEEFAALTVKLNMPDTIGVPEMYPVALFKLKPLGKAPLMIDQVIGVVPLASSH
jgi:hypothetical protein